MTLTKHEQSVLDGVDGPAAAVCMRVVVEMAGLLGAPRLIEISSAHIDGCLYHGDGGVEFAQRLVENGARVAVPTTLNVGALDLLNPSRSADVFFPVLGSWLGRTAGGRIAVIDGLPPSTGEDQLKALGAAAATTGAVGLFHVAGVTPEAHTVDAALGGCQPESVIRLTPEAVRVARDELSTVPGESIDAVALGSPHFSLEEFAQLEELLPDRRFEIPFYVCTGRGVLEQLDAEGRTGSLVDVGVEIVVDTCVVVTPILPSTGGTLMTNSGKFALYTPPNIGYEVVYGSLEDCVASASTGRVERDEAVWG
ncbi:MAG: aconitase X [Gemmatimonadota bacterium]